MFIFSTIILIIGVSLCHGFSYKSENCEKALVGQDIAKLVIHHKNPSIIYAATENELFFSDDSGRSWKQVLSRAGLDSRINTIKFGFDSENEVYLVTQDGLYKSSDSGDNWLKVFSGATDLEKDCLDLELSDKLIFLGTKQGLFRSTDNAETWQKISGQFTDSIVSRIVIDFISQEIYLACEDGIFSSKDKGNSWERIFVIYSFENPDEDFQDYDLEITQVNIPIKTMYFSSIKKELYIVTSKAIFSTIDKGKTWQRITASGLPNLNIKSFLEIDNRFICISESGVYELGKFSWSKVRFDNLGIPSKFNDLALAEADNYIWLATDNGIYKIPIGKDIIIGKEDFNIEPSSFKMDNKGLFENEPSIIDVQKAAIEYAEANIDKIKDWRRQSRLKALMPTFSIGYDKNVYGSSSGAVAVGPRGWDFDLGWDLSEIIWSNDQTSIDSRSRLTVQLRQDVLDQVNYFYFERKKLLYDLNYNPPKDPQDLFLKELELEKITANLDALTNNYFSKQVEENSVKF